VGGTVLSPPADCFATGTRIAITTGEVEVESLRVGDIALTASGGTAPVVWLGFRQLDCARHERPRDVRPVRVRAHAFGPDQPRRDLLLSPDHGLLCEGVLIPVRQLLNGASIVQEDAREITYWHIELAAHDVLRAEGLPAESYLDTGKRAAFGHGGDAVLEQPEFARSVWAKGGCAPLVLKGKRVVAAREKLLDRLPGLGFGFTDAPALACEIDNELAEPQFFEEWWCLGVAPASGVLILRSRRVRPAECYADSIDDRPLGVSIKALRIDGADVGLDDPRLIAGWHAPEQGLRWSDGEGVIDVADASVIEWQLGPTPRYIVAGEAAQAAAAG
jgi:hypothetical protein